MDLSEELNSLINDVTGENPENIEKVCKEIWNNFKLEAESPSRLVVNILIQYDLLDKAFLYMMRNNIVSDKSFQLKIMSELKSRTSTKMLAKYISSGIYFDLDEASFSFGRSFSSREDVIVYLYQNNIIKKDYFMFNAECWLTPSEKSVILSYEL